MANKNALFITNGATGHSKKHRVELDFYATDPRAVELGMDVIERDFGKLSPQLWEPFCGDGSISKVLLDRGYRVFSSDIQPRGFGEKADFFLYKFPDSINWDIVSNPPYGRSSESVEHALKILKPGRKLILFLKIQFLESAERALLLEAHPPKIVYTSVKRIYCAPNGDFASLKKDKASSGAFYCWFVWEKGYQGDTIVRRFNF